MMIELTKRTLPTNKVQKIVASNCRPSTTLLLLSLPDTFFNLLLIFLGKVRIKEPASKSLNNIAVDCRQYKKPYNKKNRKLATSGGNGGIGKVKTPRAHGFVPSRGFSHCLLYTSPSPRDGLLSRMPSSA